MVSDCKLSKDDVDFLTDFDGYKFNSNKFCELEEDELIKPEVEDQLDEAKPTRDEKRKNGDDNDKDSKKKKEMIEKEKQKKAEKAKLWERF